MNGDYSGGIRIQEKKGILYQASQMGYVPAMVELGRIELFENSFWSSKDDIERGLRILRKAALLGSVEAAHMLQDHYRPEQTDVRSDRYGEEAYARAMVDKLFSDDDYLDDLFAAAKKYHPQALFEMAGLYMDEELGLFNMEKALAFIETADQLGNPDACQFMDEVLGRRKAPSEIPEDARLIIASKEVGARNDFDTMYALLEQAAAMGNLTAHITLGKASRLGAGVKQDFKKAFHHFKFVADSGNTEAMIAVGELYAFGDGVPKNEEQARIWYQKAADAGDGFGMAALARYYYHMHTRQGNEKAIYWAKEAFSAGKPYSAYILAKLVSDPKERAYWQEQTDKLNSTPLKELENTADRMWSWLRVL